MEDFYAKKERKQRARKTPPLLPRLVILFFLLMVLLFMNIDMCAVYLTTEAMKKLPPPLLQKKTDGFLLLIPMAELSYQYEGTEYKEDKFFILPHLFGISNEAGQQITIYVNKTSPNYCLIQRPFYKNVVNWILLLLLGVWIHNIIKSHKKRRRRQHMKAKWNKWKNSIKQMRVDKRWFDITAKLFPSLLSCFTAF